MLLLESINVCNKHFNYSGSFWKLYYSTIQSSILDAIKSDEMQKNPKTEPSALLKLYKGYLSVFNIGIIAVCLNNNNISLLEKISELNNNLLVVGQILDDLADIEEDFNRGRYNYVLLKLLNSDLQNEIDEETLTKKLVTIIIKKGELDIIFDYLLSLLQQSQVSINELGIKKLNTLVNIYSNHVKSLKKNYYKQRVDILFKGIKDYHKKTIILNEKFE